MLDLVLVPRRPRQQKMQRRWRVLVRMRIPRCQCSPSSGYTVAVDAIEKNGGPALIDRVAPAGWLIERAFKARWPRCIDAARPYIAKARKAGGS